MAVQIVMRFPKFLIASAVTLAIFCGGCDGIYIYSFEGTLYRADRITPAQGVPVSVTLPERLGEAQAEFDNRSDQQGKFTGSLYIGTGWVFSLRPPAPKLRKVIVVTSLDSPIEVPLNDVEQNATSSGRHIVLPPIVLPDR